MFVTNPIAIIGEDEAVKMLKSKGLRIIERNWRMGHLEVDIIAENKNEIVFAEVKARTSMFGGIKPEEYVDSLKKRRMVAAANAYIKYKKIEKNPRFDIIGILVNATTKEITYRCHLENAFLPPLRTIHAGTYTGTWKWNHRSRSISNHSKK